jgi:hypothetical protein
MEIDKLLSADGIFKGNSDLGHQYYQILLHDQDGKKYLATIGTKIFYAESVEKSFSRLILIPAPKIESIPLKEGEVEEEGVIVVDQLTEQPEIAQTDLDLETKSTTEEGAKNGIHLVKG